MERRTTAARKKGGSSKSQSTNCSQDLEKRWKKTRNIQATGNVFMSLRKREREGADLSETLPERNRVRKKPSAPSSGIVVKRICDGHGNKGTQGKGEGKGDSHAKEKEV